MQVAIINKIKDNYIITDILEVNSGDLKFIDLWAKIEDNVKQFYNFLKNSYKNIYIEESAVLKKEILKNDFLYDKYKRPSKSSDNEATVRTELEIKKIKFLKELDNFLLNNISNIGFLKYIQYLNYFNYFASNGIFITEENKEEKYIEILDLDDESAIEKLELYLTIQEELEPFLKFNETISNLKEEIIYMDEDEFESERLKYNESLKLT